MESVWKPGINHYLRKLSGGAFSNLFVAAHTDLGLDKTRDAFEAAKDRAHAIIIDEAHHFRNPGAAGTGVAFMDAPRKAQEGQLFPPARRSRYRELFDVIPSTDGSKKQVFMLTATPINNSFHDLRHMIELFTQKKEDHFGKRLGIHSLTAHFKKMEARLDGTLADEAPLLTDSEEAKKIMAADPLVSALIVQRSRAFVKAKQQKAGAPVTAFPSREPPHRVDYSLKKVYGQLLSGIRYLNGGLFLEHLIEQAARKAAKPIDWPDRVFEAAFKFFASFSWNLNDVPGGEDNEINPDVLGYILEKYVNQKAFGAYYTRPEITNYLCERTIHRLVLDGINTRGPGIPGVPFRKFDSVPQLLKKLDDKLAARLLDDVLPDLSLLDPACGSGAFLVAAMKTLINVYAAVFSWIEFHGSASLKARLAKIRKDHASLDYFIKWRIITDNLYGVDLMPEAVEIARLRLFLSLAASVEKVEQLEPLPNIDFNIMDGNSLIGLLSVKPAAFDQGKLFGQTYDQIVADRDRRVDTYRHTAAYADDLTGQRDEITTINSKAQRQLNELLLDQFEDLQIKFEHATWDDKNGEAGKPVKRLLNIADIARLRPFHWAFAFSNVMNQGGFDAIITNPPWEIFKPNSKEFFENYSDVVTKKSMSIHEFEAEQEKLLKDKDTRAAWLDYLSTYPHQSDFFRSAPEYKHQSAVANGKKVGSDLNLYKLFVERCFRLLRSHGQCGIVIPSGIYTDLGAKGLRELLSPKHRSNRSSASKIGRVFLKTCIECSNL